MLPADTDEGAIDLVAGGTLGMLDGPGDRPDRLLDIDDDRLLETAGGHDALADDCQAAIPAHLTDECADLARPNVDSDQHSFAFHSLRPRSSVSIRLP